MILIKQNGQVYEISFRYDPTIVQLIKQVPQKQWVSECKHWTIPVVHLGLFLNQLKGTMYEDQVKIESSEHLNENQELERSTLIPNIDVSQVPFHVKEGCKPYKHQIDFMKWALYREAIQSNFNGFILADQQGLGKAFTLDTLIPTPHGDIPIKDIHVGDEVFGVDGTTTTVTGEYYHEDLEMYKVTFSDRTQVTCCKDHLWGFFTSTDEYRVEPLHNIKSGDFRKRRDTRYSYTHNYIPICKPVVYPDKQHYIDPWLLGFLIGDGTLSNNAVSVTTSYECILQEILHTLPKGYTLRRSSSDDISFNVVKAMDAKLSRSMGYRIYCKEDNRYFNSISQACRYYGHDIVHVLDREDSYSNILKKHFYVIDKDNCRNLVLKNVVELGLSGCKSSDKFIPDEYKFTSISDRFSLLQGLMDSDGYADSSNGHSYSTTSRRLAEDVCWVVRSLGGLAYINTSRATLHGKDCGEVYDVRIRIDDPRKLYRASNFKIMRATERKFKPRKSFKSIEYLGRFPGKCISVDSKDHLYLCSNFIVTHNTTEITNLAIYNRIAVGFKRCLIICCINAAKYHWYEDIKDHSQGKFVPYILGTRKKRNGTLRCDTGTKEKLEDLQTGHMYGDESAPELPYFIIMNVEGLRAKQGKKYVIADEIIDWCNRREISMIAIDEIHKGCSPSASQGKQLLRIKKYANTRIMWIPITGTPITSRPTDVFLPLRLVNGHMYTSFWKWCQKFCIYGGFGGHEIIGYRNIPYLKSLLEPNMIRRLKKDALDLPEKIYYTEYVEVTPYQNKLYNMEVNNMVANRSEIVKSLNPLSQFMHLRQICESPEIYDDNLSYEDIDYLKKNSKLQRLLEIVEEIHERCEKVVIFDNWVQPLHMLYYHLSKKYNVCVYTGTMSDEDRNHNKEVFMKNPKYTIMLGTIGALGTMHTLTAANNVIFYGEPWTAADKEQAEDRCHRISTTKNVNIYTLLAKGTVEERVHNIVYRKEGISNYIVDNIDIHSNPELFDLLLSDTIKHS